MEGSISNNSMFISTSTEPDEITTANVFMEEVNSMIIFKIANVIAKGWMLVIVPIGLVGNTLSFLIMIKPNNRKVSIHIYMAAISINDNFMMLLTLYVSLVMTMKLY